MKIYVPIGFILFKKIFKLSYFNIFKDIRERSLINNFIIKGITRQAPCNLVSKHFSGEFDIIETCDCVKGTTESNVVVQTSRHKLEQFPFSRYLVANRCNCQ